MIQTYNSLPSDLDLSHYMQNVLCWDTYVGNHPVDVISLPDYPHSITSQGNDHLWYFPHDEDSDKAPSPDILRPFIGHPVEWSIHMDEINDVDAVSINPRVLGLIYRNGQQFYSFIAASIDLAYVRAAYLLEYKIKSSPFLFELRDYQDHVLTQKFKYNGKVYIPYYFNDTECTVLCRPEDASDSDILNVPIIKLDLLESDYQLV